MENELLSHATTILLVDEQDSCRITTKWFLSNFGYIVHPASSVQEALELFDPRLHDLIVVDNPRSGMKGTEMAHIVKLRSPSTPVIMYASHAPEDLACLDVVLTRPVHLLSLKDAVEKVSGARTPASSSQPARL